MNNKNKSYATNAYILNVAEVYKGCDLPSRKFLHTRPEPVYAINCEPSFSQDSFNTSKSKINYNFSMSNNVKYWKESDKKDIVRENIEKGGIICDFKPRTTINKKISSRFFTDFVRPPCDYVQDIETEFYLIHGENSNYSSRYWKDRHETKSNII